MKLKSSRNNNLNADKIRKKLINFNFQSMKLIERTKKN